MVNSSSDRNATAIVIDTRANAASHANAIIIGSNTAHMSVPLARTTPLSISRARLCSGSVKRSFILSIVTSNR